MESERAPGVTIHGRQLVLEPRAHLKSQNQSSQGERDVAQALCYPERIPGPCMTQFKGINCMCSIVLSQTKSPQQVFTYSCRIR